MGSNQIVLDLKKGWKIVGYTASMFIILVCAAVIITNIQAILNSGSWKVQGVFALLLVGLFGSVFAFYYLYRSRVIVDDESMLHIGFKTVELPFSEIDRVIVDKVMVIFESQDGKAISVGNEQRNYQKALNAIKQNLSNRSGISYEGDNEYLKEHFGNDFSMA